MKSVLFFSQIAGGFILFTVCTFAESQEPPWPRHCIDGTSTGADGVRLMDVNGDGRLDIATGWEEGKLIRVYLRPTPPDVCKPWPRITVGQVGSPEDAVFVDLDQDGAVDVVSCCEGDTRQITVHWAPSDPQKYPLNAEWHSELIPVTKNHSQWMFCAPVQIDGKNGVDLVLGSKNKNAEVGWLESPGNPRKLADWRWHPIVKAGWIMSLMTRDLDGDGDADILVSDRKGTTRGCFWLKNPAGDQATHSWQRHDISDHDREYMFLDLADLNGDGLPDIAVAAHEHELPVFYAQPPFPYSWKQVTISLPENSGGGKSAAIGDMNLDGRADLVISCEGAENELWGVYWLEQSLDSSWKAHPVSGSEGIKFDRVELLDLDEDGDLDILTCEERANLGVIWYENPTRKPSTER